LSTAKIHGDITPEAELLDSKANQDNAKTSMVQERCFKVAGSSVAFKNLLISSMVVKSCLKGLDSISTLREILSEPITTDDKTAVFKESSKMYEYSISIHSWLMS
jgi:hypothetical protein